MTKRLNYTNRFDLSTGMMYEVCVLHAQSPFVINKGITHTVHISLILYMRAQPGILIFFCWWQTELNSQQLGALGSLLLFLCLCCICMSMYFCVCVCVLPVYRFNVCVTAGSDGQHSNLFNSLGAWATDGGPLLLLAGPAPKTSSWAAAAVRTQTKPPFTSSTQLFIFRGIRGNTRQGLSDPNSRTSLLFYTQASSQLSLIFSNCFLSCLVE